VPPFRTTWPLLADHSEGRKEEHQYE